MFSVLVIRLRSLRLLRVSGIVMRLRMFLLLITFLKASHSFRSRLLVICKNADRKSGSPGMPTSEERLVGKEGRCPGTRTQQENKRGGWGWRQSPGTDHSTTVGATHAL